MIVTSSFKDFWLDIEYHQRIREEDPELKVIFNRKEIREQELAVHSQACYDYTNNEIHLYPTEWYEYDKEDTEKMIWMINHEHLHHTLIKFCPDLIGRDVEFPHHVPYYFGLDEMQFGERKISYKNGRIQNVPGWMRIKYSVKNDEDHYDYRPVSEWYYRPDSWRWIEYAKIWKDRNAED